MPPLALALLLTAAVLHTGWNLLLKRSGADTWLVSWWALLLIGLLGLPVLLADPPPPQIWPYLVASAIFETLYFTLLAAAYRSADFSLVYPIARGAAPALIALWAVLLLGERPSPGGLLGLAVIVAGLVVVAWRPGLAAKGRAAPAQAEPFPGTADCDDRRPTLRLRSGRATDDRQRRGADPSSAVRRPSSGAGSPGGAPAQPGPPPGVASIAGAAAGWWARSSGVGLALAVALCISAYSTIDAAAVRLVPALPYTIAVLGLSAVLSAPVAIWRYRLWGLSSSAWAARRLVAGVSLLMPGAYLLAMFAYSMAPVSYAGAVREVSVIFGALAGWLLFGERLGARRVLGAAVIALGIGLIAALG